MTMDSIKTTLADIAADAIRTAWKQTLRSIAIELNRIAEAA